MYCEPYTTATLRVAFCHHVCYHFQTYRRLPRQVLNQLPLADLRDMLEPYDIRLLDLASDDTDLVCRVSLNPKTSAAVGASKLKGRLCKWLNAQRTESPDSRLFARGYLGYTVGDPTTETIMAYLDKQGLKHGYLARPLPPVLVETPPASDVLAAHLRACHSVNCLRYHLVMGTTRRRGVFTEIEGRQLLQRWQAAERRLGYQVLKISVVPDHVHLAVRTHPKVVPGDLVLNLMNMAQDMMVERFPEIMIRYAQDRLWQNGAYVGSFGDVNGRTVRRALARWRTGAGRACGAGAPLDLLQ